VFVADFKMLEILLPEDLIPELSAQATQIVADLFPIWGFVGGILLGLAILGFIVNMFLSMIGGFEAREAVRTETLELEEHEKMQAFMDRMEEN